MAIRAFLLFLISCIVSFCAAVQCDAVQKDADSWIDQSIFYGISPTYISPNSGKKLNDIRYHLPELKSLGVNTIWLQPIYQSYEGEEGYDITDYFKILPDLGTNDDFSALVGKAHELGLKIVLDFVPNHLSAHHPFVQDAIKNGPRSQYYQMFMSKSDSAPYSKFYDWAQFGEVKFLVYFWKELINLDFQNDAAKSYIHDAAMYWAKNFSIDGYRFDAAWGPVARNPKFMIQLRDELKSVKPGFMIVAEDKSGEPDAYKNSQLPYSAQIFDAVYDWTPSSEYISEWSWAPDNVSLFYLTAQQNVGGKFRQALARRGDPHKLKARVFRFIENNDTPRFIQSHSIEETKLAAALTFTLPGIPLIYFGQEIGYGHENKKVLANFPMLDPDQKIKSHDNLGLWDYYHWLTQVRSQNIELSKGSYREVPISPAAAQNQVLAFQREYDRQQFIVIANLDESEVDCQIEGQSAPEHLQGNEIRFYKNGVRLNFTR